MDTLLALDMGTTSVRAILFTLSGSVIDQEAEAVPLSFPQKGWVEQDPDALLGAARRVADSILRRHPSPLAMGITNQRETTIIWDRRTGKAIYPAIVWQDRRTHAVCHTFKDDGHEPLIRERTGLLADPYFSATKIAWILAHVPGALAAAMDGSLAFGTVDSWILWDLTGGHVHATDATNASRTLLMNLHSGAWDDDMLDLFGVPRALLPMIAPSAHDYGLSDYGIPICALIGDQQSALIGQGCVTKGMLKATYGTGCFALMHTGDTPAPSTNRLLTSVAYRVKEETAYVLEGSIFVAGSAVGWLSRQLGLMTHAAGSEAIANSVPDTNDVMVVPALTGLGAPWWDAGAQGAILNLTLESTAAHIVRATLEANGYQTADLLEAMQADTGLRPVRLRCDGGLMDNGFVAQNIADQTGIPVDIPVSVEATAWGAAFLAGLHKGVFQSMTDAQKLWQAGRSYEPALTEAARRMRQQGWKRAVRRILSDSDASA